MSSVIISTIISFLAFSGFNKQDEDSLYSTQVISLSLENSSLNWDITSNTTNYVITISETLGETALEEVDIRMSLIIEEMSCSPQIHQDAFLSIQRVNKSLKICANLNNSQENFQAIHEFFDDEESIEIIPVGNWSNDTQVRLVVSVYIEKDSCDKCPDNFFCCGTQRSSCMNSTVKSDLTTDELAEKVRCIPVIIGKSTLCNGHPNYGFFCNPDEIPAISSEFENPFNYSKDIETFEADTIENIEVVWKGMLFFTTCLFLLAVLAILTSFCNSLLQTGIFSNLCTCKLPLLKRKPSMNDQRHLTVESSFRYMDDYI